jgi:hypothetical protein
MSASRNASSWRVSSFGATAEAEAGAGGESCCGPRSHRL